MIWLYSKHIYSLLSAVKRTIYQKFRRHAEIK